MMGADALFENHTIVEIQEIEKKLRNDIERKKEELRQMVGERYRDLMDAADTITEMKEIAESVTNCVKEIKRNCADLQETNLQHGVLNAVAENVKKKRKTNEKLYAVASQLKILMDSPSLIWSCIEEKNHIRAVNIFLLARHIHSLLILDPVYRQQDIVSLFPIINRQWTSVSQFKHILLQSYNSVLKMPSSQPEEILGLLCCRCLLSTITLKEVFIEVLETRKNALKAIFQPEKYAKSQICEFVSLLQSTLKSIHVLFHPGVSGGSQKDNKYNLLYYTMSKITSKEEAGPVSMLDLQSSAVFKYLPSEITDFRPIVSDLKECDQDFIETNCLKWLDEIKSFVLVDLKELLKYVNSVQSLSLIRKAVYETLCEIENWDNICQDLLKRSFSIWDIFLKECFWERIERIIDERVKTASEFCQKKTEEVLHKIALDADELKYEKNVSLYAWSESPEDIGEDIAWVARHHRNYWSSGQLSMKTMGFTPTVQSISKELDSQLMKMLLDISHYSCLSRQNDIKIETDISRKLAAEMTKDSSDIYAYATRSIDKHLVELACFLESTLLYLEKDDVSCESNLRVVFLGHLCYGLANLCPHVNIGLSTDKLTEFVERSQRHGAAINFSATTFKETDTWKDIKKKLLEINGSALRLWSNRQIQELLVQVDKELVMGPAENILKILLQWDKVEIQEESEQGKSVKSILRIPQHVSTPVSNALFSLSLQLNAVGGFSISSDVRSHISSHLLTRLLAIYRCKSDSLTRLHLHPRILQLQSLQILFDVQYLCGLLGEGKDQHQDIVQASVARVDPFDMDVFAQPLQQNIKKALQKTMSLFGLMSSPDQLSYLTSLKSLPVTSSHNPDPNAMLIPPGSTRFPLLPISTGRSTQQEPGTAVQDKEPKSLPSHSSSSPNLIASDPTSAAANPMKSAASFYDQMTAMSRSWFGNLQ